MAALWVRIQISPVNQWLVALPRCCKLAHCCQQKNTKIKKIKKELGMSSLIIKKYESLKYASNENNIYQIWIGFLNIFFIFHLHLYICECFFKVTPIFQPGPGIWMADICERHILHCVSMRRTLAFLLLCSLLKILLIKACTVQKLPQVRVPHHQHPDVLQHQSYTRHRHREVHTHRLINYIKHQS